MTGKGYFTNENIDGKSKQMLESVERYSAGRRLDYSPEGSALLVIDMQRYFLDERSHAYIPSAKPVLPRLRRLAGAFTARGLPVVCTRHVNSDGDAGMMSLWWDDLIREGDEFSEIVAELQIPEAFVVRKTQYDAFYRTPLEGHLREKGARRLVVTGVMTHLCCETTARSAFMRGFGVYFAVDGTATYREEFHRASVLNLSHGFAVPVMIDELLERF
jgi:isochorismate hydrolase